MLSIHTGLEQRLALLWLRLRTGQNCLLKSELKSSQETFTRPTALLILNLNLIQILILIQQPQPLSMLPGWPDLQRA